MDKKPIPKLTLTGISRVLTSGIHSIPTKPPFDNPHYVDPAAISMVLGNCVSTIGWEKKHSWFRSIPIGYDLSEFSEVLSFAGPYQYFFLSMGKLTKNTIRFLESLINIPSERIGVLICDPKLSILKNYGEETCHTTEKLLIKQGVPKETASQVWKLYSPGKFYGGGLIKPKDFLCPDTPWIPIYYAGIAGKLVVGDHYTNSLSTHYLYDHVLFHSRAAARTANKDRGNYLNYIDGKVATVGFKKDGFELISEKPLPLKKLYPQLKKSKWHYICNPSAHKDHIWGPTPRFLQSLVMGGIALYNEYCEYLVKDPLLREMCIVPLPSQLTETKLRIPEEVKLEIYQRQLEMFNFYTSATSFDDAGILLKNQTQRIAND